MFSLQQLLTCQIYTEKEGLRQQQLLAIIPRHHKHYILPSKTSMISKYLYLLNFLPFSFFILIFVCFPCLDSVNKKVHFSPHIQTDPRQHMQARARLYSPGGWFHLHWMVVKLLLTCRIMFSLQVNLLILCLLLGASAAKTLSWHLASETKSTLKGSVRGIIRFALEVLF